MAQIFKRVLVAAAIVIMVVVGFKLILAMLAPILPPVVTNLLNAGWRMLFSMLAPALPAVAALALLSLAWWVFSGRRR